MSMLYLLVVIFVSLQCRADNSIVDPRKEYHSAITSGERAYLLHLQSVRNNDTRPHTEDSNSAPSLSITKNVPREMLQLSSPSKFNATIVDQSELLRTQFKAEEGSIDAAYFLGLFYLYGLESLEPNEETAVKWFRKSADGGHNDARCAFGLLLYHGYGSIEEDKATATEYFRMASREGNSFAHLLYGKSLYEAAAFASPGENDDDQIEEAAGLFQMVYDDIPEASHMLGVMYEYGLVKSHGDNFAKAVEFYENASQRGYLESTYHLALMHSYGRGVPEDHVKAAEFFRIAASHPFTPHLQSMRYLAIILANGYMDQFGVPNFDEALYWYDQCCSSTTRLNTDVQNLCIEEREILLNFVMEQSEGTLLAVK